MESYRQKSSPQCLVTYPDVSVNFSLDEWVCLNSSQRKLYRDVMLETYQHLQEVGNVQEKPALISCLERGDLERLLPSLCAGEERHVCQDCGKCFSHRSSLSRHRKTHSVERPFKCRECGKGFKRISHCNRHQITHTGEKPHVCCDCGRGFTQKGSLVRHQKSHTGENLHVCCDCGRGFSQRGSLVTHQRIHTGEKPHVCGECGRSFSVKGALKRHQRIHTRLPINV